MKLVSFCFSSLAAVNYTGCEKESNLLWRFNHRSRGARNQVDIFKVADLAAKASKSAQCMIYSWVRHWQENSVYDLYLRSEDDVLSRNPDVVVIYIGVNDVWHKQSHGTGTDYDKFENFMVRWLKDSGERREDYPRNPWLSWGPNRFQQRVGWRPESVQFIDSFTIVERKQIANCLIWEGILDNKANNPENKRSGYSTTDRVHLNDKGKQP